MNSVQMGIGTAATRFKRVRLDDKPQYITCEICTHAIQRLSVCLIALLACFSYV